jgi:lipopolysaccharide export LptBFGC system permease protein LptF
MRHCFVLSESGLKTGYFEDKVWPVALPPDFGSTRKIRASDLTWMEILDRLDEVAAEEEQLATQIALTTSKFLIGRSAADLPARLKHLKGLRKQKHHELFALNTELQMRPALSMGCLCFVLIGCPVGMWFSRGDYLSAFITCFLPIVFLYYPILLCGTNFAKSGAFDPLISMWAANIMMGVVALVLFRRLLRN